MLQPNAHFDMYAATEEMRDWDQIYSCKWTMCVPLDMGAGHLDDNISYICSVCLFGGDIGKFNAFILDYIFNVYFEPVWNFCEFFLDQLPGNQQYT